MKTMKLTLLLSVVALISTTKIIARPLESETADLELIGVTQSDLERFGITGAPEVPAPEPRETPPPVPPGDFINPALLSTQYLEFLTTEELNTELNRIQTEKDMLKPTPTTPLTGDNQINYVNLMGREKVIDSILSKRPEVTTQKQRAMAAKQDKYRLSALRRTVLADIGRYEKMTKPLTQKQNAALIAKQNELATIDALLEREKQYEN